MGRGGGREPDKGKKRLALRPGFTLYTESTPIAFFISWDFIFPGENFPFLCVSFRGIPQTGKKSQKNGFIVKMNIHPSFMCHKVHVDEQFRFENG